MTEKSRRTFLVRNIDTGDGLFVVEAADKQEAIRRSRQVLAQSDSTQNVVQLNVDECESFDGLPFFLEAYFKLFRPPTMH